MNRLDESLGASEPDGNAAPVATPRMESRSPDDSGDDMDDPRVIEVVHEYLKRLEAGEVPDRSAYIHRYPELAESIQSCLDGLELVHRAIGESRPFDRSAVGRDSALPDPLGDFRIVRELGRGGMGIVYEAVQLSLGRKVALKVLPFAGTLQPRQLQRFLNEAQASAHLHHPNIVPVFAVGSDRGVHYYAMQLIDGMSLAEVLEQLRVDSGLLNDSGSEVIAAADDSSIRDRDVPVAAEIRSPRRRASHSWPRSQSAIERSPAVSETVNLLSANLSTLKPRQAAEYFRTVARWMKQSASALAYAHELGIVHRDIKPANLMLDARGNIWVTDFGLAQFRSGNDLTQTGDLVGTARYMSPEQTRGNRDMIDHRTDVYSLGATLYELATLRPIFDAPTREGLLYHVGNVEPKTPRALNPQIPHELETIILKAISKSPQDRYSSAQDLADDLQRFLNDEPIQARRPSLFDRVRKWSRRHPATVISAVVLLTIVAIGQLVHNRIIAGEQQKTAEALAREQQRSQEANDRFLQARQAVDVLIQVSEEDLVDQPKLQATRQRLLETAVAYYQDFIEQKQGDVESQLELEAVQERVRGILRELAILRAHFQTLLLGQKPVQDDLTLSDEQLTQLREYLARSSAERGQIIAEVQELSIAERKRRFLDLAETSDAELDRILRPSQRTRLRQIFLQTQGLSAFREPDVLRALDLRPEQRSAIREIELSFHWSHSGDRRFRRGSDNPPGESGRRSKQSLTRALALLDDAQRSRWEELCGPPFDGPLAFHPLEMPGNRPPGPPGSSRFDRSPPSEKP